MPYHNERSKKISNSSRETRVKFLRYSYDTFLGSKCFTRDHFQVGDWFSFFFVSNLILFIAVTIQDSFTDKFLNLENKDMNHSLIRVVLIQSCSTRAENFTNYVFCHPQFISVVQNIENHCAIKENLKKIIINIDKHGLKWHNNFQYFG